MAGGEILQRNTHVDWAHVATKWLEEDYPEGERLVSVMHNLSTNHPSSLHEEFRSAEARPIA